MVTLMSNSLCPEHHKPLLFILQCVCYCHTSLGFTIWTTETIITLIFYYSVYILCVHFRMSSPCKTAFLIQSFLEFSKCCFSVALEQSCQYVGGIISFLSGFDLLQEHYASLSLAQLPLLMCENLRRFPGHTSVLSGAPLQKANCLHEEYLPHYLLSSFIPIYNY